MEQQYETISKFDRMYGGLVGGNNLKTNASTILYVNPLTGESETFVIQTVRGEEKRTVTKGLEVQTVIASGNFVVITHVDKDGTHRLILPPKVSDTIARQSGSLVDRARSNAAKAQAKIRKLAGVVPGFMRKKAVASE
jgi:hypothetical protein